MSNPTLNRFIRRTIYSLKRSYGSRVDVYKLIDVVTDYKTGVKTISKSVNTVRRCVVLPVKVQREVIQTISQISANKMFVCGGSFDAGSRMFIIDSRDLPSGYEFSNDDWLVYDNHRYDIKSVDAFEQHTAWVIVGKELVGVIPEQIHKISVENRFDLNQEIKNG